MTDEVEPEIRAHYWILFIRSKTFWQKFFCGSFSHIAILKNDGYNWIFIDPRPCNVHITILPFMSSEDIEEIFKYFNKDLKGVKVYIKKKIIPKPPKIKYFLIPKIINCVRATKYVLGIKVNGIFPVGFYNQLARLYKEQDITKELIVSVIQEYRSK